MQNNRRHERFDMSLSVSLKDKTGVHPLKTGNISKYGLFLESSDPKPPRQLIKLLIEFPHSSESIEVLAQVMWSDTTGKSDRSGGHPGMGVKFFSMPDNDRRRWENFVDMVRTGRIAPEEQASPVKEEEDSAKSSIYTIGQEELEELNDLELDDAAVSDALSVVKDEPEEDLGGLNNDELEPPPLNFEEPPEDKERRVFPRKIVAFLVKMKSVDTMRELYTRDISLGGMFLKTTIVKKEGDPIEIIIVHPWTSEEYSLQAEVRRVELGPSGAMTGIGVRFIQMNENTRDSLLMFIESGYLVQKEHDDTPIESAVIRRIEAVESKIMENPIDNSLHFQVGLLYLGLSDWEKSFEHLDIAHKLGYPVPEEVFERLQHHRQN